MLRLNRVVTVADRGIIDPVDLFWGGCMSDSISTLILSWYDVNKRRLSFRDTGDPYRVLVSEFMLQQTRAETAEAYFDRFIARFFMYSDHFLPLLNGTCPFRNCPFAGFIPSRSVGIFSSP